MVGFARDATFEETRRRSKNTLLSMVAYTQLQLLTFFHSLMVCLRYRLQNLSEVEAIGMKGLFEADLLLPRTTAWMMELERLPEFLKILPLPSQEKLVALALRLNKCSDVSAQRFLLKVTEIQGVYELSGK